MVNLYYAMTRRKKQRKYSAPLGKFWFAFKLSETTIYWTIIYQSSISPLYIHQFSNWLNIYLDLVEHLLDI